MTINDAHESAQSTFIGMKELQITKRPKMDFYGTEAVNSICTNILFAGNKLKTILLTSCVATEGKSSMAARILMQFAHRGLKTVYVDVDLRKSKVAGKLGLKTEGKLYGLSHYLAGRVELENIVYKTDIPNAYMIPAGKTVANSVALINSQAFTALFDRLKAEFDMIVVDTPPIGVVIDAADIAPVCDGSVMVIEYGKRHRHEVQQAVKQMKLTSIPVLGCIIDKVTASSPSEKRYYKNHYYYSHYGEGYENKSSQKTDAK